jgi:ribosome-binding protein aMBF1 (putative translation factor)
MAGMKDKKPDDKHARVLEKLFSVPVDEDAEEADEDQEQDAGMYILRLLQGRLLISWCRS